MGKKKNKKNNTVTQNIQNVQIPRQIQSTPPGILINDAVLPTGIVYRNRQIIYNSNYWHKFIVSNAENLERNYVLSVLLNHVHPLDFIPVHYITDQNGSSFLARNCGKAIEKFCHDNLLVANLFIPSKPFKLSIILRHSSINEMQIDVQQNITNVLMKRFKPNSRTLNLERFHKDEDLEEFCPLSQPKIMYFVLHLSKHLQPLKLKMGRNNMKQINSLETMNGCNITSIDLSHNFLNLEAIKPLQYIHALTELKLEGNPLCSNLDEYDYIAKIKEVCPNIEKLDGVPILQNGMPVHRKNFFCDLTGVNLVDQFLEHFFTIYDTTNRHLLEGLYHRDLAMFSMTVNYISFQITSATAQLRTYKLKQRNIKALANYSRTLEGLYTGSSEIIQQFLSLPRTEHDPFSFTADLIYYTEKCAIIVVTGVFREIPDNLLANESLMGFTRTFVLERFLDECYIVNEQLHIYNALNHQFNNAFKTIKSVDNETVLYANKASERQQMEETYGLITNLSPNWCKKCLEECNYELKSAINLFIDLYKVDKIPVDAFTK